MCVWVLLKHTKTNLVRQQEEVVTMNTSGTGGYNFSRSQTAVLITLYRKFPMLYQKNDENYKNRPKRLIALESIADEFHDIFPEATLVTVDHIKRKINGIRTQFFAELAKIKKSRLSGAVTDSVYTPTLWCFDSLYFLNDGCQIKSCKTSLTTPDISESESTGEVIFDVSEFNDTESILSGGPTRIPTYLSPGPSCAHENEEYSQTTMSRKRKHCSCQSSLIEKVSSLLEESTKSQPAVGEIEAFGMLVVAELKNIKSSGLCRQLKRNIMNMIYEALESEEI